MIHRSEHNDNFMQLDNELARNVELSDGAFRLLVLMLSMTDNWEFSTKGLASMLGVAERTILYRLSELRKAGYISYKRTKNERGLFVSCSWDVYEAPLSTVQKNHSEEKLHRGKTTVQKNHSEVKPQCSKTADIRIPIYKENQIYKEDHVVIKEKSGDFDEILKPLTPELQDTFREFIKMRKTIKAPMTVKALDLAIKKAEKLGGGDPEQMKAVVEQSIMNSWKGLFPLKEDRTRIRPEPIKSSGNEFLDLYNKLEAEGK